MKIYLTGSNGFIVTHLTNQILNLSYNVVAPIRNFKSFQKPSHEKLNFIDLEYAENSNKYFENLGQVDCLIHCAARAHIMKDKKKDSLNAYREVNVKKTKKLAEAAVMHGIKRFIFLSSVKVNGEKTNESNSFNYYDSPNPQDFYSISKFEAENVLWEISERTGLKVTVVRLPLVYGHGVKGNLKR